MKVLIYIELLMQVKNNFIIIINILLNCNNCITIQMKIQSIGKIHYG